MTSPIDPVVWPTLKLQHKHELLKTLNVKLCFENFNKL